ncbi:MAG TPA: T9SS type A sorting domain-containing protein, partial [Bacteroidia bacterium]|nr:T9SS type A sorting domain-containing protein [Bacteroidia bacterium]
SCFYNVASVTSPANTTWKDSVCVTVTYPCTNSATLIIPDSTYSTSLNYRYDTLDIYIAGRLYVNDTLKLMRCNVYMNAGAHIIVQNGGYLDIDSSTVAGCTNMWRGITVLDYGELIVHEGSTLTDADTTVLANNKAKATLHNAYIRNFVLGVYMPPSANVYYNGTTLKIEQTTFDFTVFKQNYTGQNTHGAKPQCGVLLNDWIGTIGTYQDSLWLNKFLNLNNGIIVKSSTVTVKNCFFNKIQADAFYGKPYNGTAVASVGDIAAGKRGNLTMQPVMNNHKTMTSCYGGVWTSYSTLNLNNVRMDSMYIGATVNRCKDYLSATIAWNEIKATRAGIVCNNNAGAAKMALNNNTIHVNGTGLNVASGIIINEINKNGLGNYSIDNNYLYLYNVRYGIRMQNVYKPLVAHNYIEQNNSSSNLYSEGITSNNCDSTQIRCNGVRNLNVANTATKGIVYSISSNASISCNSIDSTATGIFFGGNCMGAQLKGNTLRNNLLGLYINNVGLIGVQPNNGNKFIDYRDTVGAYNANLSFLGLPSSQFNVRTTDVMGNIYYPVLAQQNLGWFQANMPNNPYTCGSTCYDMLEGVDNETLYRIVAGDSIITEEFIPESQSMARQYLFQVLANNDSLLASDTLFQNFYNEMLVEAEGQLLEVERRFETYGKMDSTFAPMLHNVDSLLKEFNSSVEDFEAMRDSIEQSGTNADSLLEQWIIQIENLETTRQNIILQYNAVVSGEMYEGELANNTIQPDEVPEYNSARLNEIFIDLEETDYSTIEEFYSELLEIANQCPYYGGEAVYRARAILELYNDSLIYNDDAICLQYGIYKQGVIADENKNSVIIVKPNPANEYVFVKIICNSDEKFNIQIVDAYGRIVCKENLSCNKENKIITRELSQGVYTLLVKTTKGNKTYKIAIVR